MKKTIVVPVDFSGASVNAANYAIDFAMAINAAVALVHVCELDLISEVPISAETIAHLLKDAEEKIGKLKEALDHKTGKKITIYTEVRQGTTVTQIKEYCQDIQPAIVIMGAHGTTAAERFFFGSNTLSAVRNLAWPLIIVPAGTRFTGITRIGLACDLQQAPLAVHAAEIKFLYNEFHPQLHVLHVTEKKHGMLDDNEIKEAEWVKEILKDTRPVFHFMQNENIEDAINEFSEKNNLSLLIVIPRVHGLLNRLFHKSHSKKMVLQAHIPVMSIHE
jgi:nucleotide-binding universal stress UspA family protein